MSSPRAFRALFRVSIASTARTTQRISQRTLFGRATRPSTPFTRARNAAYGVLTLAGLGVGAFYATDSRSALWRYAAMPILHLTTDPEQGHWLAIKGLGMGIGPFDRVSDDERLAVEAFGKKFSSPVSMAAGFDKQAEAIDGLFDLGFSYVEIGSVTPLPQPGNPLPRFFRLPDDKAVINRYGFNSDGHEAVARRLRDRVRKWVIDTFPSPYNLLSQFPDGAAVADAAGQPRSLRPGKVLGVNLGKNKTGEEIEDYVKGVRALGAFADILVINVSSPNTPGLRSLQKKEMLASLLTAVVSEREKLAEPNPRVCVKIAPDLTESDIEDIAWAVKESKVDGVIVSNTTISRPSHLIHHRYVEEIGGLSGPPVKPLALTALRTLRRHLPKEITIIGAGGISNGKDAVEFARAGASLVQVYTAFGYEGPGLPRKIKDEILEELGGQRWVDIIGTENAPVLALA
ncbi:hypothetical protein G7K_3695-t1 [Saitoella complicata NRRL Y-17804]|uniref:Dihydroorotate dehydrogenase (quinone), mitochondrial n=2 Tax=Saitoella complicata (strain BCRC 22490 / CBS 7301 / JCM 7358 / NBRC 10748 / NRRL Y-17804) TaxID=698492 RepID=A0A0E9NIP4_SAICN|nr:hypothetical protein G7K_3695-t1 [Saitoella complicata NRRL Y-17804]